MTDSDRFSSDFSIRVDRNITGEAGLCITVGCFFTVPENIKSEHLKRTWFKGDPQNPNVEVPCIGLNIHDQNLFGCHFQLKNLVEGESDGEYRFKVEWGKGNVHIFPETVKLTVKELTQKPIMDIPVLTVGQWATLSCTIPGGCLNPIHQIVWTGIDNATITQTRATILFGKFSRLLSFDPEPEHHKTKLTCTVIITGNIRTETSVILKVRFAPRIRNTSSCSLWGDKLTCMCVSDGIPLAKISWPLLGVAPDFYSIATSREDYSMSNISISGFSHLNSTVKCISKNELGAAQMEIPVNSFSETYKVSGSLSMPWMFCILSVVLNVIFSVAMTVLYLWRRRGNKTPKDDKHVYMTTMRREESLYETINTSERS
nr:sialic acid-binding Ig-like lectin 7 [Misgurnus anguillicaudatus]